MKADEQPSPEQIAIWRRMTPSQRWRAAYDLYWTVRKHKEAYLCSKHPEWSKEELNAEIRRIFLHATT